MEVDAVAVERTRADLVRAFPDLAGRKITHAWGGPIDVSPTHLPAFGTQPGGGAHYGFGFTGNGVGPTHMGGRILAALALDRRDPVTQLALVEPEPVRVPPEPFRFVGGTIIRAAYLRKERLEDEGREADPVTRFVTGSPSAWASTSGASCGLGVRRPASSRWPAGGSGRRAGGVRTATRGRQPSP